VVVASSSSLQLCIVYISSSKRSLPHALSLAASSLTFDDVDPVRSSLLLPLALRLGLELSKLVIERKNFLDVLHGFVVAASAAVSVLIAVQNQTQVVAQKVLELGFRLPLVASLATDEKSGEVPSGRECRVVPDGLVLVASVAAASLLPFPHLRRKRGGVGVGVKRKGVGRKV